MLKEPDNELEARGLRFTRYANGCAIAVKANQVPRGWINDYALGAMKISMTEIDAHLRIRLVVKAISKKVVAKAGHET